MTGPERRVLIASVLVHAAGLAWVARHDVAKLVAVWRRRRATASDLDGAMHTVWLEGKWRWITKKMTTEEREAAVAAVLRYSAAMHAADGGEPVGRSSLAWWEN